MSNIDQLSKDVEELKGFFNQAQQTRVQNILSTEIRKLETEIDLIRDKVKEKTPATVSTKPAGARPRYTVQIDTYAWDQSEKFMKIYVTANGVQNIPKENITCDFKNRSVRLHIENLDNKNYELAIGHFSDTIVPTDSYHKIKTDMVLLMLRKTSALTWAYVTEVEKKQKESKKKPKYDDNKDPQAGLMDMMKNMYDEGDDDMKRTIAKAWTQSRDKKDGGGDMPPL